MATRLDRLSDYGIVGKRTKSEEVFLKIEKHFRSNKDTPSVSRNTPVRQMFEEYVHTLQVADAHPRYTPKAKISKETDMDKEAMIQEIKKMLSQLTDEQLEELSEIVREALEEMRKEK